MKSLISKLINSKFSITMRNNLNIKPADVEIEMEKWLWRYRSGGEFAKV